MRSGLPLLPGRKRTTVMGRRTARVRSEDRRSRGGGSVHEHPLGDLVADHLAVRPADQIGDEVGPERRDEHHEDGGEEPPPDPGRRKTLRKLCHCFAPRSRAASMSWKSNRSAAA
jgi:hypothetical protein